MRSSSLQRQGRAASSLAWAAIASACVPFVLACARGERAAVTADSTAADSLVFPRVAGTGAFVALALGERHTCGLDSAGAAWCWGLGQEAQLGGAAAPDTCEEMDGTRRACAMAPLRVSGEHPYTAIAAGGFTCALGEQGAAWCWGPRAGVPATAYAPPSRAGDLAGLRTLTVGSGHACALAADSTARCWGRNDRGQLGSGTLTAAARPVSAAFGRRFVAITAGGDVTCVLTVVGDAFCWGANDHGQLGIGAADTAPHPLPIKVPGGAAFRAIDAGDHQVCALGDDGRPWCWGRRYWTLGPPSLFPQPAPVPDVGPFAAISVGGTLVCGARRAGGVACWGRTATIGVDPIEEDSGAAARVAAPRVLPRGVRIVEAGAAHACAIEAGGAVRCWGDDDMGQLGIGQRP